MPHGKKPMNDIEKKAKLTALKDANKVASDMMSNSLKDSKLLKKHVKDMSNDTGIDFKNDSDKIKDPTRYGNVVGRHISDENITPSLDSGSVYNVDEIDAQIEKLLKRKAKAMDGR